MSETPSGQVPQQETRGGHHVDWARAVAGEPLPELPAGAYAPDAVRLVPVDEAGDA